MPKKIIVTGMPRSGTSETMGLLFDAGLAIRGEKWPSWFLPDKTQFQPDGYWESLEVCNGIDTSGMPEDAVKIMLTSFFDCRMDDTDIVILCERDEENMAESQRVFGYCPAAQKGWQKTENGRRYALFDDWARGRRNVIRKNHEFWLANKTTENARILNAISSLKQAVK